MINVKVEEIEPEKSFQKGENYFYTTDIENPLHLLPIRLFIDKELSTLNAGDSTGLPKGLLSLKPFLVLESPNNKAYLKIFFKENIYFISKKELLSKNVYKCKHLPGLREKLYDDMGAFGSFLKKYNEIIKQEN